MTINTSTVTNNQDAEASQYNDMRLDVLTHAADGHADTGSANAYEITVDDQITSLVSPQIAKFIAGNTNTGASTLRFKNSLALDETDDIKRSDGTDLRPGDISSGGAYICVFDGTNWQLLNPVSSADVEVLETTEDLVAGDVVSYVYGDKTKVEKSRVRWSSDGVIDSLDSTLSGDAHMEVMDVTEGTMLLAGITGGSLYARIVTVDKTGSITQGTLSSAIDTAAGLEKLIKVGDEKFVALYIKSNQAYCAVIDASTATPTSGTGVALPNQYATIGVGSELADISTLEDDKFIAFYEYTSGNDVAGVVGSISGTTITYGTDVALATTSTQGSCFVEAVSSTKAFVMFEYQSTNVRARRNLITVSGTTVTFGSSIELGSDTRCTGILKYSSTQAIIAWHSGTSGAVSFSLVNVSGAASTPSKNFASVNWSSLRFKKYVEVYNNSGTLVYFSSSGDSFIHLTSTDIAYSESKGFTNGWDGKRGVALSGLDGHGLRFVNTDGGVIETVDHYGNFRDIAGVVNGAYSNGDTDVVVFKSGKVTGLSGLTDLTTYYLDRDGSFVTNKTPIKLGVANGTTALDMDTGRTNLKHVFTQNFTEPSLATSYSTTFVPYVVADVYDLWQYTDAMRDNISSVVRTVFGYDNDTINTTNFNDTMDMVVPLTPMIWSIYNASSADISFITE